MVAVMHEKETDLRHDLAEVTQCIYGNWITQVTYVFAELGIADKLMDGPMNLDDLAAGCGVLPNYLMRTLRCTFELGYLTFDEVKGLYYLTPKGALLSSNHPHSKREEARFNGADYRYFPWGNLLNILKNGLRREYSPTLEHGSIEYLRDKPELLKNFNMALHRKSMAEDGKIASAFDFSPFTRVMDIGCGYGSFVRKILDLNPHLQGCMFDLEVGFEPGVEDKYKDRLIQINGDFFEEVPDWADVYTMKNTIHNWPEDKTVELLIKTREAMQSTSSNSTDVSKKRLLVIENVVTEDDSHQVANWMDLNFMILIDGAERTIKEYSDIAEKCGLKFEEAVHTPAGRHILSFSVMA